MKALLRFLSFLPAAIMDAPDYTVLKGLPFRMG